MADSTWAGYLTAMAAALTVITLIVNSYLAWKRDRRVEKKVDQVHTIVNQQRTDMQRYIRALSSTLKAHDIDLPVDQSIDPEENVIDGS